MARPEIVSSMDGELTSRNHLYCYFENRDHKNYSRNSNLYLTAPILWYSLSMYLIFTLHLLLQSLYCLFLIMYLYYFLIYMYVYYIWNTLQIIKYLLYCITSTAWDVCVVVVTYYILHAIYSLSLCIQNILPNIYINIFTRKSIFVCKLNDKKTQQKNVYQCTQLCKKQCK